MLAIAMYDLKDQVNNLESKDSDGLNLSKKDKHGCIRIQMDPDGVVTYASGPK